MNDWHKEEKHLQERFVTVPERSDEVRTPYERDYSRIIHSQSFRRLQSKTQVLGLGESDFYRTRLTHSLEVAQVGLGITQVLRHDDKLTEYQDLLPSDALLQTICLSHDLGHPPFGHGGEVALNYCMRDFDGFEGNGQTLRILSKLEKYHEDGGSNLTRRTLLGILKYPAPYRDTVNNSFYPPKGKTQTPAWMFKAKDFKPPKCYLNTEQQLVTDFLLKNLDNEQSERFTKVRPNGDKHFKTENCSFDASIMELADDISYGVHDLEDAISLKLIRRNSFKDNEVLTDALRPFLKKFGHSVEDFMSELFSDDAGLLKRAIGKLVHYLITQVSIQRHPKSFGLEILNHEAFMFPDGKTLLDALQKMVEKYVIFTPTVQQLEFKGQKIVVELFQVLSSDPERLLPDHQKIKYKDCVHKNQKMRIICDFIAGMTDDYATRFYQKLLVPREGSIFDRVG